MKTKLTAEQERNQIQNAYSYIRLSSKRQTHNDKGGIDRQLDGFRQVCNRFNWTPQTQTFSDLGVSAFSGDNRLKGELSEFMQLALDGKLAPTPCLVLESLDRFSRQDIDESEPAVLALLKSGVAIHVKFTGQTFTRASTVELGDRIQILVALKAAHSYSQQLSERVTAAKTRKLARFENGEAVNICDFAPRWIDWNKDSKTLELNDNSKAVEIIFREYQGGASLSSICRTLHSKHIPSFLGGTWTKQTVRKILSNPATYGEFRGKQGVFPAIVTKAQFESVQIILSRNAGVKLEKGKKAAEGTEFGKRGRTSKHINIFRGLVRCSECGHSMSMNSGRNHPYYRCDSHIHGACGNRFSVRASLIEENLICGLLQASPEELLAAHDKSLAYQISNLTAQREAISKRITALLELAGMVSTDEIKAKMLPLKTERDSIDTEVSKLQLQSKAASSSPEVLSVIKSLFVGNKNELIEDSIDKALEIVQGQLSNTETRIKIANIMPQIVKSVVIKGNEEYTAYYVAGGNDTDSIV